MTFKIILDTISLNKTKGVTMKTVSFLYIILISIIISGCATKTELAVNEVRRSGIDMIVFSNEAKAAFVKEHGNQEIICASRESDAIKTSEEGMNFGISTLGTNDKIGEESGTGSLSLGGRSPIVLITRELMFRACELSMNLNTNTKQTIEIYKLFLNSIHTITKNEHEIGSKSNTLKPENLGLLTNPNNTSKASIPNDDSDDKDSDDKDSDDKDSD